jgi:hypothetical protein
MIILGSACLFLSSGTHIECVNLAPELTGALYFQHSTNVFEKCKKILKKYIHVGNDIYSL